MANLAAAVLALALPLFADAYTWQFKSQPTQCGNVSISVSGGGSPPYEVLIIPVGSSPLPNNIEARKIQDQTGFTSSDISFKLNFPADSQFVAVVSDSTGFGSGGTSVNVQVGSSSDSSCFDSSKNVAPPFTYSVFPIGVITQCTSTRIWWTTGTNQGNPTFQGVIPGGNSFAIPQGSITNMDSQGQGTGFSWTPPLRGMTTLILVGGDDRGKGSAGSNPFTVQTPANNDNSCLNSTSPSSTAGSPAGGSYSTSSSGAGTGGGGSGGSGGGGGGGGNTNSNEGSKTNVAAIAGGTVGGVALLLAIVLIALFFLRRRRLHRQEKVRPDLLMADDGDEGSGAARNELPQFYQPEPFMVEDPTGRASLGARTDSGGRPISTVLSESRSGTPDPSTSMSGRTGKSAPMRQMRPVNVIQHADAGPSVAPAEEEPETVELPPAYTNIRKDLTPESVPTHSAPEQPPATATATQAAPAPAS